MNSVDAVYQNLVATCMCGPQLVTRNSECRRAICRRYTFRSTPLVTLRKAAWKNALREWEWFMSGSNWIEDLHPSVQHWWKPWADEKGNVEFNYSHQFRTCYGTNQGEVDQIAALIDGLKNHPNSRRHVITTWNAADMLHPRCPITNCHNSYTQIFVHDGHLYMRTFQRSADVVCGVPHNWIQQWAFLMWLAYRSGHKVLALDWEGGDCHVYQAHYDLAKKICETDAGQPTPQLVYKPTSEEFRADDFTLDCEYKPVLTDKAEMVV